MDCLKAIGDIQGIKRRPGMSEDESTERDKHTKSQDKESARTSSGGTNRAPKKASKKKDPKKKK